MILIQFLYYTKSKRLQENIISFLPIGRKINPNMMTFIPEKTITRVFDSFFIECVRDYLYNRYLQDGSGFHSKDQCVEEIFREVVPQYLAKRKVPITWTMPSERDFYRSIYKKFDPKSVKEFFDAIP